MLWGSIPRDPPITMEFRKQKLNQTVQNSAKNRVTLEIIQSSNINVVISLEDKGKSTERATEIGSSVLRNAFRVLRADRVWRQMSLQ